MTVSAIAAEAERMRGFVYGMAFAGASPDAIAQAIGGNVLGGYGEAAHDLINKRLPTFINHGHMQRWFSVAASLNGIAVTTEHRTGGGHCACDYVEWRDLSHTDPTVVVEFKMAIRTPSEVRASVEQLNRYTSDLSAEFAEHLVVAATLGRSLPGRVGTVAVIDAAEFAERFWVSGERFESRIFRLHSEMAA